MPLNLDSLGAKPLVTALLNPAVAPRIIVRAFHAGAVVFDGPPVMVSRSGDSLRLRGHAPLATDAFTMDGLLIEFDDMSVRTVLAPGDYDFRSASPGFGLYVDFLFTAAAAFTPPQLAAAQPSVESRVVALEQVVATHATATALQSETARATNAEATLTAGLAAETSRAQQIEQALTARLPGFIPAKFSTSLPGLAAGGHNTAAVIPIPEPGQSFAALKPGDAVRIIPSLGAFAYGEFFSQAEALVQTAGTCPAFELRGTDADITAYLNISCVLLHTPRP